MGMTTLPPRPGAFFSWAELQVTQTGLLNDPTPEAKAALVRLCREILDPLRRAVGPIRVTSGYRSAAVNLAVRGSKTSSHRDGEAGDIKALRPGVTSVALALAAIRLGLPFDQLILYAPSRGGHVHISYREGNNRGQVLYAPADGGYMTPDALHLGPRP